MYRYRRVIIFERNSTIEVAVCHHELSRSEYELKNEYFFHGLRHR